MEQKEVKIVCPMKGPGELGAWKWKTPQESCVSSWEVNTEGEGEGETKCFTHKQMKRTKVRRNIPESSS